MKSLKIIACTLISLLLLQCSVLLFFAQAELIPGDSVDCTDVSVDYLDDPSLTREERLKRMDAAFYESVNRFELCQTAREAAASAAAGGAAGSGSGTGGLTGEGEGKGEGGGGESSGEQAGEGPSGESVASSTMSGTEPPEPDNTEQSGQAGDSAQNREQQGMAGREAAERSDPTGRNGKLPEDIPSAANDDALAAQIRYAAEHETDPEKQVQLWNEYRKYKGLPLK